METYAARAAFAIFSAVLIFAATTITLLRPDEQSTVVKTEIDVLLVKSMNAKVTVKDEIEQKPKLGESVYKDSDLHKYSKKFSREIELAKGQRKKTCGIYVKYSAIDCDVCILFVHGLKILAEKGSTQEDVADFSKHVCIDLKIEDERVCAAITQEFKVKLYVYTCISYEYLIAIPR